MKKRKRQKRTGNIVTLLVILVLSFLFYKGVWNKISPGQPYSTGAQPVQAAVEPPAQSLAQPTENDLPAYSSIPEVSQLSIVDVSQEVACAGKQTERMQSHTGIAIHHTAHSRDERPGPYRWVEAWVNEGGTHAPYHFLIANGDGVMPSGEAFKDGTVWQLQSLEYRSGHSGSSFYNLNYISVAIDDNLSKRDLTPAAHQSLIALLRRLCDEYGIPVENIKGHRKFNNTECPGNNLDMDEIRVEAARAVETHQETQTEVSGESVVGLWVDAFNTPLQTKYDVDSLVDFANEKGVNLLVAEVRKRGVVYYSGSPEPMAVAGFDPLAYLLKKTDTAGIAIHAWLDAGWRNESTHLDFTNPVDREYLKSLVRPLLDYESLEGIHLDWIRYDESVEITDGYREALTSLVSEISDLCHQKGKELSVAAVTWDPSPQRVGGFAETRPYLSVGQDWESWVEDEIIDILMPMNYFSDSQPYEEWLEYETNLCSNANVELIIGIPDYMGVDTDGYKLYALEAGADGVIYYSYSSLRSKESIQGIATGPQGGGVAGTPCGDDCIWSKLCAERAGIHGTVCVRRGSCSPCGG